MLFTLGLVVGALAGALFVYTWYYAHLTKLCGQLDAMMRTNDNMRSQLDGISVELDRLKGYVAELERMAARP